jgi:hypothetical protein
VATLPHSNAKDVIGMFINCVHPPAHLSVFVMWRVVLGTVNCHWLGTSLIPSSTLALLWLIRIPSKLPVCNRHIPSSWLLQYQPAQDSVTLNADVVCSSTVLEETKSKLQKGYHLHNSCCENRILLSDFFSFWNIC